MARHRQDDLPQVARFVAVMTDDGTLRSSLPDYLTEMLARRYPADGRRAADGSARRSAPDGLAWHSPPTTRRPVRRARRLPCRIYVSAHPCGPPDRGAAARGQAARGRGMPVAAGRLRLAGVGVRDRARVRPDRGAAAGVPRVRQPRCARVAGHHRGRLLRLPRRRHRDTESLIPPPSQRRSPTRRCCCSASASRSGTCGSCCARS